MLPEVVKGFQCLRCGTYETVTLIKGSTIAITWCDNDHILCDGEDVRANARHELLQIMWKDQEEKL